MTNITVDSIETADILLYHGNAMISRLIRFFDGTEVNHAAICIGKRRLGEAEAKGLTRADIDAGIKSPEYMIVRRLKTSPDSIQPVIDRAEYYLKIGNKYAFGQILLLAFLGLSRKLQVNPYLKLVLRKVLDQAADWLVSHSNTQPMICSEFVYRCYNEAEPSGTNPYKLNVEPSPMAARRPVRGMRALNVPEDSLLAWVNDITVNPSQPANDALLHGLREDGLRTRGMAVSPEEQRMLAMPLDDLINEYLNETQRPPARRAPVEEPLRTPEMFDSITRFSKALHSSQGPGIERRQVGGTVDETMASLSHLIDTVPDFVTPGDLLKCTDLSTIGQIP